MEGPAPSSIRFPSPLRERIPAQAAAERRTFSGAVVRFVQVALSEQHERDRHDDVEIERLRLRALSRSPVSTSYRHSVERPKQRRASTHEPRNAKNATATPEGIVAPEPSAGLVTMSGPKTEAKSTASHITEIASDGQTSLGMSLSDLAPSCGIDVMPAPPFRQRPTGRRVVASANARTRSL
jgi:hypothetical protein